MLRRSMLVAGCALFLASSFIWSWAWPIGLMGLVLTLYTLSKAEKLSTKQFLLQSLLFGYVFFGIVLCWIYGIHTTELIGDTPLAIVFLALTFVLMVGALATGFMVFGLLYRKLHISTSNKTILLIPVIWTLGEFFRSIFFSIFAFGKGGSIGPLWNFGVLGFGAMSTPLRYASRMVGLFGTSFLIVLIAVIFFQLLHRRYKYGVLLFVPLLFTTLGWSLYHHSVGHELTASTVSVNGDIEDGYQAELTQRVKNSSDIDILVLPEYSYYFTDSDGVKTSYTLPDNVELAIDSSSERTERTVENRVSFYNNKSELVHSYPKHFLIPGGEYIPYIYHVILFYSGNTSLINDFQDAKSVTKATEKERPFEYHGVTYGSLACSGAIAPGLYSNLTRQGATVLTNSASISTLGVSPLYYKQAAQMSAFTATANARPFIQAARGGPSYILSKDGTHLAEIQASQKSSFASMRITTNKRRTIYTVLGEWTLWLSSAIVIILMVNNLLKNKNGYKHGHKTKKL